MIIDPITSLQTTPPKPGKSLPLIISTLSCGFPSPADDYTERVPSLNELLISHPSATFLARASGDSMIERGIMDGSLLIIDRSQLARHNATIVASINGEMTVKILDLDNRLLRPANPEHASIPLPDDIDFICEGVVTHVISSQPHYSWN